jgi:hypothetical protein
MKHSCLCLAIVLIPCISLSDDGNTEDALVALSRADQLESSLLGEGGQPSTLTAMFAVLAQSDNREQQFERLITKATTDAGKAYGFLGLYMSQPDRTVERARSLPVNFKVRYMLFCINGEWGREEFAEQLKNGNLLGAVSYRSKK